MYVNLTSVRLVNEDDRRGSVTSSPRVSEDGRLLQVVIAENDNNRGLVSFTETNVSVVESFGATVMLQIVRERGAFGQVGVSYEVRPGTATAEDYTLPITDMLMFESGEVVRNLSIAIVDDVMPELDEVFEVVLVGPTGGVAIGTPASVSITIPSNDDINGVFSFTSDSLLVRGGGLHVWVWYGEGGRVTCVGVVW